MVAAGRTLAMGNGRNGVTESNPGFTALSSVTATRAPDTNAKFTLTTTGRSQRLDRPQMSVDAPMHVLAFAPEGATVAGRHIGERKLR